MGKKLTGLLIALCLTLGLAGPAAAADLPTQEQQDAMRVVAGNIWTPSLAAGWEMNNDVAVVLGTATQEIYKCSEAFALVPKPVPLPILTFGALVLYFAKYSLNVVNYFKALLQHRTYRACVVTAAANYRTPMELASMGEG